MLWHHVLHLICYEDQGDGWVGDARVSGLSDERG